jgi:putative nucleotidyltransferase with HDIG domain
VPKKILLVDDDPDILSLLKQVLLKEKYQIVQATNGQEAEDVLEQMKVNLVITDVTMPIIDGVELVHWIEEKIKIPTIVMTSHHDLPEVKKLHEEGITHFLNKPLRRLDVLDLVDRIFNHRDDIIQTNQMEYVSVPIDNFLKDEIFECPIFVRLSNTKYVKIANNTETLNKEQLVKLKEKNVTVLHLTSKDYEKRFENSLEQAKNVTGKTGQKNQIILNAGKVLTEKIYLEGVSRENFEMAMDYVESSLDSISKNERAMNLLEELNNLGDHFFAHCMGVSTYSVMLAKQLGWTSEETFRLLSLAGIYHDIGFKDSDISIINKDLSELEDDEFKLIQNHPIHGADLVSDLKYFPIEISQVILQHHEACNGEGYPFHLKKDFIFPPARIVYITDMFCDLVLTREGYEPVSIKEALTIMATENLEEMDQYFFKALCEMFEG